MTSSDSVGTTATAAVQQQSDLVFADVEVPQLQAHQVYVEVEFAAFNPTDSTSHQFYFR